MGFRLALTALAVVVIGCGDNYHPGRGQLLVSPTAGLFTTESGGTATFTVALTDEPVVDQVVELSSLDPNEGEVSPRTLIFTPLDHNVPRTVTITGVDDLRADGNTSYLVRIEAVRMGALDLEVTNEDDDLAGFVVTPQLGLMTSEAGLQAAFTVQLTSEPVEDVAIPVASADPGEGTADVSALVFTPANWDAPQTVTVTGVQDTQPDGTIGYTVVLGAATSLDAGYDGLDPDDINLANIDDDDVRGIVASPLTVQTNEGGGQGTFSVVLQSQPTAAVTIAVTSSDTSEATVAMTQLVFTPTNYATPQSVTVTGVNDVIDDGDQPFTVTLGPAISGDADYNGIDPDDIAGTNLDDDTLGVTVTPLSIITTEAGGSATINVSLNTQPTSAVTIAVSSTDTTEGTVSPASLLFTPANWNVPQTVTVVGVNDPVPDGNQSYTIIFAPAVSTDASYSGFNPPDVAATNIDNDFQGFTVVPTSGLVVTEFLDIDTFTIRLNTAPTANVTVGLSSSDTTEGFAFPTSVTFTQFNWNTPQTVTVRGLNDTIADGNVAFSIITAPAVSADVGYSGLNPPDVQVTNIDNDTPQVVVRSQPRLFVSENGSTANFRIGLTVQPASPVTCTLFSSDLTEGAVSPSNIVFTPTNFGLRNVTVLGLDDALDDGDIDFAIITNACTSADPAYTGKNPQDVDVTNRDND